MCPRRVNFSHVCEMGFFSSYQMNKWCFYSIFFSSNIILKTESKYKETDECMASILWSIVLRQRFLNFGFDDHSGLIMTMSKMTRTTQINFVACGDELYFQFNFCFVFVSEKIRFSHLIPYICSNIDLMNVQLCICAIREYNVFSNIHRFTDSHRCLFIAGRIFQPNCGSFNCIQFNNKSSVAGDQTTAGY